MAALNLFFLARSHAIIAQIIKAKFRVRAISDVASILLATDARRLIMKNATDGQAEKFVNRAHPFGVARGKIIVHRHDMNAASRERIEINWQRADERFTFAGGHFCDATIVQAHAADELHVERNHFPFQRLAAHDDFLSAQAAAGVFDDGERFGQNFLQGLRQFVLVFNRRQTRLPIGGFLAQFVVGKFLQAGFQFVDLTDDGPEFLHFAVVFRPEDFFD